MKKLKTWQVVLLVIFYPIGICVLIYRVWKKGKLKREREEAALARKETKEREEAERRARIEAELASREELAFKIVGVTFKNEDGSTRQSLLRKLKFLDPPFDKEDGVEITVKMCEYEGEPAFAVYAEGLQLGNIGREDIPLFLERWRDYVGVTSADVSGGGKDSEGHSMKYGLSIKCLFRKKQM